MLGTYSPKYLEDGVSANITSSSWPEQLDLELLHRMWATVCGYIYCSSRIIVHVVWNCIFAVKHILYLGTYICPFKGSPLANATCS